jgi:hypothetical protein
MYRGRLVSYLVVTKGLLTLSPGAHAAVARRIRQRAEIEYFYAREKKLAVVAQRLRPVLWVGDILMPGETQRLRVALERCQHLAAIQRADELVRERRVDAYSEARASEFERLRSEAQARVLGQRPDVVRQVGETRDALEKVAAKASSRPVSAEAVEQLRAGMRVLELHRPRDFQHLAAWRGREHDLLSRVVEKLADPATQLGPELRAAAHLAGRVGYLVAKERNTPRGVVPSNLRSHEKDILLANARFKAADAPLPFPPAILTAVPQAATSVALGTLRQRGFLAEGPEWALRAGSAREVSDLVRKPLERLAEQDLGR